MSLDSASDFIPKSRYFAEKENRNENAIWNSIDSERNNRRISMNLSGTRRHIKFLIDHHITPMHQILSGKIDDLFCVIKYALFLRDSERQSDSVLLLFPAIITHQFVALYQQSFALTWTLTFFEFLARWKKQKLQMSFSAGRGMWVCGMPMRSVNESRFHHFDALMRRTRIVFIFIRRFITENRTDKSLLVQLNRAHKYLNKSDPQWMRISEQKRTNRHESRK